MGFVNQKWVPYSQRYLFNAIPDTNHNANPTNPNRYSKGNPNPTNPNTRYRIIEPSDYRYITGERCRNKVEGKGGGRKARKRREMEAPLKQRISRSLCDLMTLPHISNGKNLLLPIAKCDRESEKLIFR